MFMCTHVGLALAISFCFTSCGFIHDYTVNTHTSMKTRLKADNCCEKVLATRSFKDEVFDSVDDLKHELFQTDVMLFWRKH